MSVRGFQDRRPFELPRRRLFGEDQNRTGSPPHRHSPLRCRACEPPVIPRGETDRRLEAIAPLRNRFDVRRVVGRVAERLAEREDVVGEVRFLHEGVRPHLLEELFLGNQPAWLFDQRHAARRRPSVSTAPARRPPQQAFSRVERKRPELKRGEGRPSLRPAIDARLPPFTPAKVRKLLNRPNILRLQRRSKDFPTAL